MTKILDNTWRCLKHIDKMLLQIQQSLITSRQHLWNSDKSQVLESILKYAPKRRWRHRREPAKDVRNWTNHHTKHNKTHKIQGSSTNIQGRVFLRAPNRRRQQQTHPAGRPSNWQETFRTIRKSKATQHTWYMLIFVRHVFLKSWVRQAATQTLPGGRP